MFSQFAVSPKELLGEIAKKAEAVGYTVTKLPGNCIPPLTSNSQYGYALTSTGFSSSNNYQQTNPYDLKFTSSNTLALSKTSNVYWQVTLPKRTFISGMAITSSVELAYPCTGDNITLTVYVDNVEIKSVTFDSEWDYGERRCVMFDSEVEGQAVKMTFKTESSTTCMIYSHGMEVLSSETPSYLLQSKGESGLDNVNILLDYGNYNNLNYATDKIGTFISLIPLEDADVTTGNMKGMNLYYNKHTIYTGNSVTSGLVEGTREIEVALSITKDRIVLCTKGNPMNSTSKTTTSYTGLPSRFSNEPDSSAMLRGSTSYSETPGATMVMRNQLGQQFFRLNVSWITSSVSPTSWGDKVFMSPAFLDAPQEGMRGELDGVKFTTNSGIVHGDEVTVGSTKYFVTINSTEGSSSFPTVALLIDKTK